MLSVIARLKYFELPASSSLLCSSSSLTLIADLGDGAPFNPIISASRRALLSGTHTAASRQIQKIQVARPFVIIAGVDRASFLPAHQHLIADHQLETRIELDIQQAELESRRLQATPI